MTCGQSSMFASGFRGLRALVMLVAGLSLAGIASAFYQAPPSQNSVPQRAQDPAYGAALFEYYQGAAFDALIELAVAEQRGGIQGHGDYPDILRGGMLLTYGMPRAARALFQSTLGRQLPERTRNLAWFYLGKVFYLERRFGESRDALGQIDLESFRRQRPELANEQAYMRGQIALAESSAEAFERARADLSDPNPYAPYLDYNAAIDPARRGEIEETLNRLPEVLETLEEQFKGPELTAFLDQIYLTAATLHLQQGDLEQAMAAFRRIHQQGPVSDQALFGFALAAARGNQYGLALEALNVLSDRPLFNPLVQQVPYAVAYLHEQAGDRAGALQAYREATQTYAALDSQLGNSVAEMNEAVLLAALGIEALGLQEVSLDSYGRIRFDLEDHAFASRVSGEDFQIALRDLHELYRMQSLIERRASLFSALDAMLSTREYDAERKREQTESLLAQQASGLLRRRFDLIQSQVESAENSGDIVFFMNPEQREYAEIIDSAKARIRRVGDPEMRQEMEERLRRVESYFRWWASETFADNRWRVRKALSALQSEIDTFETQRKQIDGLKTSVSDQSRMRARVDSARQRLAELEQRLESALAASRSRLLNIVKQDFQRQRETVRHFLALSQESLTRLLDENFRAAQAATAPESNPETVEASEVSEASEASEVLESISAGSED